MNKLVTKYSHQRTTLGYKIDSRAMEVEVLPEKRAAMIIELATWIDPTKKSFTLREVASLHGVLENMTRYVAWARPLFYLLQNVIRIELTKRYHYLQRSYQRTGRSQTIRDALSPALMNRLSALIARDKAKLLWSSKAQIILTQQVRSCLTTIHDKLADTSQRWAQPIGYIIPRDPHVISLGDASLTGGGAYCEHLAYWFDIVWSPRVCRGVKEKADHADFVHINSLEFIVVLLQMAAAIVRLESLSSEQRVHFFPKGFPVQPILMCRTDNTAAKKWANKVTSKSQRGQQLIGVMAELLRTRSCGIRAQHIPGVDNGLADFISRPTNFTLSHSARSEQLYQMHASARTWDYFQPSQELLQSLSYALFSSPTPGLPSLPKNLGQFVAASSTTSSSAQL